MNIRKRDIKIETMRGQGPGGQHRNKTDSCVRATHVPTGVQVKVDGRNQHANRRKAIRELEKAVERAAADDRARRRKAERDRKVREEGYVRTYNEPRDEVTDHRTKAKARFKEVVKKGNLDALWDA